MPSELSFQSLSIFFWFYIFPTGFSYRARRLHSFFFKRTPLTPSYPVRNIPLHRWQWLRGASWEKSSTFLKRGSRQAAVRPARTHMCLIGCSTRAAWRKMQGHIHFVFSHPLFSRFSARRTRTHTHPDAPFLSLSLSLSLSNTHTHVRKSASHTHVSMRNNQLAVDR